MKYIALLRGIGPGDPNMSNEKLRGVVEGLGYGNVESVISSGNIVFESNRTDIGTMETEFEGAWKEVLGFESTTVIKSKDQLLDIVQDNPFGGMVHGASSYLLVTFCKNRPEFKEALPFQPEGKTYKILEVSRGCIFTTTDNTVVKTTDLMTWLEKRFGKEMTSRSLGTIERILRRMG